MKKIWQTRYGQWCQRLININIGRRKESNNANIEIFQKIVLVTSLFGVSESQQDKEIFWKNVPMNKKITNKSLKNQKGL